MSPATLILHHTSLARMTETRNSPLLSLPDGDPLPSLPERIHVLPTLRPPLGPVTRPALSLFDFLAPDVLPLVLEEVHVEFFGEGERRTFGEIRIVQRELEGDED